MRTFLTKLIFYHLLFVLGIHATFAQQTYISDDFEDGDISDWISITDWEASGTDFITGTFSLKHALSDQTGTSYISHSSNGLVVANGVTSWQFNLKSGFDPSSTNNFAVVLMSDKKDLSANYNGYMVGVDRTNYADLLELYKVTAGSTQLIYSTAFSWPSTQTVGIKVTRTTAGEWEVFYDADGGFDALVSGGTVTDTDYATSDFMGMVFKFGTASRAGLLFLDDLTVEGPVDSSAPVVNESQVNVKNKVNLVFNEPLDQTIAETVSNYTLNGSIHPISATLTNFSEIELLFAADFQDGQQNTLVIQNIEDLSGNVMQDANIQFVYENVSFVDYKITGANSIDLSFTKSLDQTSVETLTNYSLFSPALNPITAELDVSDNKLLHLEFAQNFNEDVQSTLSISNLEDTYGNAIEATDVHFSYHAVQLGDIVFSELMVDEAPAQGLPEYEYIELYNRSDYRIELTDYHLVYNSVYEYDITNTRLEPQAFVVLMKQAGEADFIDDGISNAIGMSSFPSLGNTSGKLALYSSDTTLLDYVFYDDDWYKNTDYDNGGYSLERIDCSLLCAQEENWTVSTAFLGGTPGKINAVAGNVAENKPVELLEIKALTNTLLKLVFSEPISDPLLTSFTINNSIGNPTTLEVDSTDFVTYMLSFATPFTNKQENILSTSGTTDWCGNAIADLDTVFSFNLVYPTEIEIVDNKTLKLYFSEEVTEAIAETLTNYTLNTSINPTIVYVAPEVANVVNMQFADAFTEDIVDTLHIENIQDTYLNVMLPADLTFQYHVNKPYEIVMNEIMANPSDETNLPDFEYVELYNRSDFDLNLKDWTITVGSSKKTFTEQILPSREFLLLVPTSVDTEFDAYGGIMKVLGSSDLTNGGTSLTLSDKNGVMIDQITYSDQWYKNNERDDGGYSLEKIDPNSQCGDINNWQATTSENGGTPGEINAVFAENIDNTAPTILNLYAENDSTLYIQFSEIVDTTAFLTLTNFIVDQTIGSPKELVFDKEARNWAQLIFHSTFADNTSYQITLNNIQDLCSNSMAEVNHSFDFYIPKLHDVVITEVMLDQTPAQGLPEYEYLEIYNRSTKELNLKNWSLLVNGKDRYMIEEVFIPSHTYLVLLKSTASQEFRDNEITAVHGMARFPEFSNTSGAILLQDNSLQLIDAIDYTDDWYNDPDRDNGGFSVERIDLNNFCGDKYNWAASTDFSGGTPGKQNSVFAENTTSSDLELLDFEVLSNRSLRFSFSDYVLNPTVSNFSVNNTIGNPDAIEIDSTNFKTYTLSFSNSFQDGVNNVLSISNIKNWCDLVQEDVDTTFAFHLIRPLQVEIKSKQYILVHFSDALDKTSAEILSNYLLNDTENPTQIFQSTTDLNVVHLYFSTPFTEDQVNTLKISGVSDQYGNFASEKTITFVYHLTKPYDVVVNEIMATPEPSVGLPIFEYIELYNQSASDIILNNWILSVGSTQHKIVLGEIASGEYLIVCDAENLAAFESYGRVLAIEGLKTLSQYSGTIELQDPDLMQVAFVAYDDSWFQNEFKAEGGWSLEQIDVHNSRAGAANWIASDNERGGTPGAENSVKDENPNREDMNLLRVEAIDSVTIRLYFDQTYDFLQAIDPELYNVNNSVGSPLIVNLESPEYKSTVLVFENEFEKSTNYEITISNELKNYSGTAIENNTAQFQLPEKEISESDILINEILYDPINSGTQFIELYNNSENTYDLSDLYLAVMDNSEMDAELLSEQGYLFFPGEFLVFTEDKKQLQTDYYCKNPQWIIETDLPGISSTEDTLVLMKNAIQTIDILHYTENMQYALLAETEGVSLERVNFSRASDDETNWKSAASTVGYATPTYENSQFMENQVLEETIISLSSEIFSPDNDGYNDLLDINLSFDLAGYNIDLTIYDAKGRQVRKLKTNELAGTKNIYSWDGLDDQRKKAPIGIYILLLKYFDLDGNTHQLKKTVVLGGKI